MSIRPLDLDPSTCFINGAWVTPDTQEMLEVKNPSTGDLLCHIARGRAADIDAAVEAATRAACGSWATTAAFERGRALSRLSQLVLENADQLARVEALDVGKPLRQARADVAALARYLEFYGGATDKIHGDTLPYLTGYTAYTLREPHGVTGHIVPWNYPMQII